MSTFAFVGLPGSGKSTFLAAFWNALRDGDNGGLALGRLSAFDGHLNLLRDDWLSTQALARTPLSSTEVPVFHIRDGNGNDVDLEVPDLSGEIFERAVHERGWPPFVDDMIASASGIIMFVHPSIRRPVLITDVATLAPAADTGILAEPEEDENEWSPSQLPTQVMLVELVQFILGRNRARPLKLSLVISAWDRAKVWKPTALAWLESSMPLLYQYLMANKANIRYEIFGVSAQGGDYGTDAVRLQDLANPAERVIVVKNRAPEETHDISAPIEWLLDVE